MHKYHAKPVTIDGIRFASTAEGRRYSELKQLERAGQIERLELQPEFPIVISGKRVAIYRADFAFVEGGKRHVVDVKGVDTPLSRLKRKCVEAQYGIRIEIERRARAA